MTPELRQKLWLAALGFLMTGVLGAMVTTWIQERGWTWQNHVATIEKDTENARATFQTASDLINARWYATYRLVRAIERDLDAEEWKNAREEFAAAEKDWAIKYTSVAQDVAFFVDTPFAVDGRDSNKLAPSIRCDEYALGGADVDSARLVLAVINNCAGLITDDIYAVSNSLSSNPPKIDAARRKSFVDPAYRRLDALYKTNEALRCIIFTRALAMRRALSVSNYWVSYFGFDAPSYKAPDPKSCLG